MSYVLYGVILSQWLLPQADDRKSKLIDSLDFQRFLSDFRDLMSWISSMMALVSSNELAQDVTGAEALLERHQVSRSKGNQCTGLTDDCFVF